MQGIITIIPIDKYISINGVGKILDFEIDNNIHAVQWNGQYGFVEQVQGGSRRIDDLSEFYDIIDLFNSPEPESEPPTLEQAKSQKLAALSAYRYSVDTGGFNWYGQDIATDDRAKTLLAGARTAADAAIAAGVDYQVNWKTSGGWAVIDAATIVSLSNAVREFVQHCFDREKEHYDLIMALVTVADVIDYDFTTNWQV